jgi:hypothetical protein
MTALRFVLAVLALGIIAALTSSRPAVIGLTVLPSPAFQIETIGDLMRVIEGRALTAVLKSQLFTQRSGRWAPVVRPTSGLSSISDVASVDTLHPDGHSEANAGWSKNPRARSMVLNGFLTQLLNHRSMSQIDLERVREWANAKLSASQESQRAGHHYMKVRETVDAILAKISCGTFERVSVPRETPVRTAQLRLVWSR